MTRTELTTAIRRHSRYRHIILSVMAAAVFGAPIANIVLPLPAEVVLGVFIGVPLLGFGLDYVVLRVFGVRCLHCGGYLGLEKKRFYDVTKTGRCRGCGMEVIDDVA